MKKVAVILAVYLVALAAMNSQAAKQRIPIVVKGGGITEAGKFTIDNSSIIASNGSQLVLALDFDNNTVDIEEWNASLTSKIQRNSVTNDEFKALVISSFRSARIVSAKSNSVVFACDLETGFPITRDWNKDGTNDTSADWQLLGKATLNKSGVVTKVSGKIVGVMNDPVEGDSGVNAVLQKGTIKSIGPVLAP